MEDRMNAGLMFIQVPSSADQVVADLDRELRQMSGISEVSWWRNQCPDRDDWIGQWRRIKEDTELLALCEIDGDTDKISPPPGLKSLRFRRAARPSQGVLRLPTLGLCIVLVSPSDVSDDDAARELRDWGDFVHFPGIVDANIPGYGLVTPYVNVEIAEPLFLHLYEFPDADAEAVFQRTRPSLAQRFDSQPGEDAFERWATHPLLELDYLGNFTRVNIDEEVLSG